MLTGVFVIGGFTEVILRSPLLRLLLRFLLVGTTAVVRLLVGVVSDCFFIDDDQLCSPSIMITMVILVISIRIVAAAVIAVASIVHDVEAAVCFPFYLFHVGG